MKQVVLSVIKNEIVNLMRSAGYSSLGRGKDESEFSFVRSFGRSGYPRFHLFIRFDKGKGAVLDLHLDQKKPVYSGARAHDADYEGLRVEEEMDRIKSLIV